MSEPDPSWLAFGAGMLAHYVELHHPGQSRTQPRALQLLRVRNMLCDHAGARLAVDFRGDEQAPTSADMRRAAQQLEIFAAIYADSRTMLNAAARWLLERADLAQATELALPHGRRTRGNR